MKTQLAYSLLFLLLATPQMVGAAELDSGLQKRLKHALDLKDYQLAESMCKTQLELLPADDSIQRAISLMQHGDLMTRLTRESEGLEERNQASQMIERLNCKDFTDAELDMRATAYKLRGQDIDGPCGYISCLQRAIKRSWFPVRDSSSRQIKVQFNIHRNGKLSDLHIIRSSGIVAADTAALSAVTEASPFYPLPEGAPPVVTLEFAFDYKISSERATNAEK